MHDLIRLPSRLDAEACTCRAIVETPAGSRAKFDFDPETGLFLLAGLLPAGMRFPLDSGFIPSTRGEDGDPIDLLILAESELPVGCLVQVRLIGVIEAHQTEKDDRGQPNTVRNDRLVGRIAESRAYANIEEMSQLGDSFADELKQFFITFNELKDKRFEVLGVGDAAAAARAVQEAADCDTPYGLSASCPFDRAR